MSPVGILLIVGFVVIFVFALYLDKSAGKKFQNEIAEKYPAKDSIEKMFVTEKGELLYYLPSGTLPGYKKWDLQDIAYVKVSTARISGMGRVYYFAVAGADKKNLKGEYLTPSKKKFLLQMKEDSFTVTKQESVNQFVEFIKKQGPHIQQMS